jgi:undecaprenyl-diphosphatase
VTSPRRDPPLSRTPPRWERRLGGEVGASAGAGAAFYVLVWAVVIAAALIGVGMLLSHVAPQDAFGRADISIERWLAGHRDGFLNTATAVLSAMANTKVVTIVGLALAVVAGLTWRRWREPMLLVIGLVGELAIFLIVSAIVHRSRPPVLRLDVAPPTSSFPSGHTTAAVVLYAALAVLATERFRGRSLHHLAVIVAIVIPLLVGASRMYRGMHYPTDVAGGLALGVAWLTVSVHAVRIGVFRHRRKDGSPDDSA